jgi:hypothetical protein
VQLFLKETKRKCNSIGLWVALCPEAARCNSFKSEQKGGVIKLVLGSPCAPRWPGAILLKENKQEV